jgi:hypothetical protein
MKKLNKIANIKTVKSIEESNVSNRLHQINLKS